VRLPGAFAALGAAVAALVVSTGWLSGLRGDFTLEAARASDDFPLYYAGEEVDGLPLTPILRRDAAANYVSFVYGDCMPGSDGGCAPPAEVQVWPGGVRNAGSYDLSLAGTPIPRRTTIRGLPAAFLHDETHL
jgi:hypothetical protein